MTSEPIDREAIAHMSSEQLFDLAGRQLLADDRDLLDAELRRRHGRAASDPAFWEPAKSEPLFGESAWQRLRRWL